MGHHDLRVTPICHPAVLALALALALAPPLAPSARSAAPDVSPAAATARATPEAALQQTAVAMRIENDQPVVEVRLGAEGPFRFLVDTGAQGRGRIDQALAKRLGLKTVGSVQAGDPSGRNSRTRALVRVPRLTLGTRTWRDVDLLVADDPQVHVGDGVLGFELWSGGLLTLDYPKGELRFGPGTLPPADGSEVLDYKAERGIPTLTIDVAGTTIDADIDSGSMGWLAIPASAVSALKLKGEPRVVGQGRTSFNQFDIREATLDGSVRIGRHVLEDPTIAISEIFPRGNLGGRLLRSFAITFDPGSRRVRLSRDTKAPIAREPRVRSGVMLQIGPDGMVVTGTAPGSPAEKAGLQAQDRITRVNGRPIDEIGREQVGKLLGTPEPVMLTVRRGDRDIEVRLTPAAMP